MLRSFLLLICAAVTTSSLAHGDDWPQWMGPKRDSVWRESGLVDRFPASGPKTLWRVPVDGGFSGPAVAGGKVFLFDFVSNGDRWNPGAGKRDKLEGTERVQCFNAADGRRLWTHEYNCHYDVSYATGPRCTPTVAGGKVYALGTMGTLNCLDADSGRPIWSRDLAKDFNVKVQFWGFCGHPLVDGQKLIVPVGGDGTGLVAFDKDTGKEIWRSLSCKDAGYSPPTLIDAGGKRQLLFWSPESINSVNPEDGKLYWSSPLVPEYGMSIMAPRQWRDYLFAGAIGYHASLLKLASDKPDAKLVWEGKKGMAVYPVNSTPFIEDGIIYGVDQPGPLRAVKVETGERLWESFKPVIGRDEKPDYRGAGSGTAFLVKNGDRFVLFGETGDLIFAKLSPKGYDEICRAKILEPTLETFGRKIVWSHPAFANKCVFARNDKELVCVSLAAE